MKRNPIRVQRLTKTFDDVVAVNDLDLTVEPGTVLGLIGRNGAGKTTLIRLLLGLLQADRGEARVFGDDLWDASPEERMRIGYVSQEQQLYEWMTPEELCSCVSQYYSTWDQEYARSLADTFMIDWSRPIGTFSGGQKRKTSILVALAPRPDLLVLDEPAAGLDPVARRTLIDLLVDRLAPENECTVLFSTHIISDLERIVEDVAIMQRGQIYVHEELDELQARYKKVQVVFDDGPPPENFHVPGAVRTETSGPVVTALARLESETQLDEIKQKHDVRVNTFPLGLEDLFIEFFREEDQ